MATFNGTPGNDSLAGGSGDDILVGGAGADTLNGAAGDDVLFSGSAVPGFSHLINIDESDAQYLDRGAEIDTLVGGDGTDYLFAGYGDNVAGGPNGSYGDYLHISFLGALSGVTADFRLATQTIGGGTITGIENLSWVEGSNFGDTINAGAPSIGYSRATVVHGMGGDDILTAGHDTGYLYGDEGDDTVDGRGSWRFHRVDGGAGNDFIYTDPNLSGWAFGGDGNDVIYSHGLTYGGAGNDLIILQESRNYGSGLVHGEEGDDEIRAAAQGDTISGGAGADRLVGSTGNDILTSGDFKMGGGYDLLAADMTLDHDVLTGGGGNDVLAAGYGDDVDGGAGSDVLLLSLGGYGGGLVFSTAAIVSGQPFSLAGGVIRNIETFERLRGTDFSDTITAATQSSLLRIDAGDGDDVVYSSNSSVSLVGGAGDDRFISGAAIDIFDGGAGSDTIDYSLASAGVSIDLVAGTAGGDSLSSVENAVGSMFNDTIVGSSVANLLEGGAGADRLYGGAGDDTFYVNVQDDLVFEFAGEGTDTVITSGNYYLYEQIENLTLWSGAGDIFGVGNGLANTITGNAGANLLLGGGGNDTLGGLGGDDRLYGEDGNDVLTGGAGADWLVGGAGDDTLDGATGGSGEQDLLFGGAGNDSYRVDAANDFTFEDADGGTDTVTADFAGGTYYLYGNVENLTLAGTTLYGVGNELDNVLVGSASGNWLLGGAGNDTLNGKAGGDVLFGQGGADTFVFERGTGGDVIGDFAVGVDKVKLAGIYSSFAEVQSHMVQNGTDSAIVIGDGDLVVFQHVAMNAFTANDFLF